MIDSDQQPIAKPKAAIFIFINSGSGGGLGSEILKEQINKIEFQIPIANAQDIQQIEVHFVNMRNQSNRLLALKKLNAINQENQIINEKLSKSKKHRTFAIVCGGDGSVMWVVEQFVKAGVDLEITPLGIIPVGTGNDFSRSLGWGPEKTMLLEYHYRSLKKLIRKWLHASIRDFDLWEMIAEIYPSGKFQKRNSDKKSAIIEGEQFRKTFCNYFSFGIDGKVGYSFDKYRAKSRIGNLAVYGSLGLKNSLSKNKPIDELVSSFHLEVVEPPIQATKEESEKKIEKSQSGNRLSRLLFKSRKKSSKSRRKKQKEEKQKEEEGNYFDEGLVNVLALNINSYTGGTKDIWKNAKQIPSRNKQNRTEPSSSDGKLELVSFASGLGLGFEKFFGGFARRLSQDSGPYVFKFHEYPEVQNHRTYLQIDGQFIRFTHPKQIIIQQSGLVPGGKIKVLQNDPLFVPFNPQK